MFDWHIVVRHGKSYFWWTIGSWTLKILLGLGILSLLPASIQKPLFDLLEDPRTKNVLFVCGVLSFIGCAIYAGYRAYIPKSQRLARKPAPEQLFALKPPSD